MENAAEVRVSVRLASGKEVTELSARPCDTVRSLKKRIHSAEGTPVAQLRLLSGHALLSNKQTLEEAGIRDGTILQLVRMMPPEEPAPVVGTTTGNGIVILDLDEYANASYEPTEDEIDEYAEWLGMDPDKDASLLWIAREGLKMPVQPPWRACETADGYPFFFNFATGESTWDHPIDEVQRRKYKGLKAARLEQAQLAQARSTAQSQPAGRLTKWGPWKAERGRWVMRSFSDLSEEGEDVQTPRTSEPTGFLEEASLLEHPSESADAFPQIRVTKRGKQRRRHTADKRGRGIGWAAAERGFKGDEEAILPASPSMPSASSRQDGSEEEEEEEDQRKSEELLEAWEAIRSRAVPVPGSPAKVLEAGWLAWNQEAARREPGAALCLAFGASPPVEEDSLPWPGA